MHITVHFQIKIFTLISKEYSPVNFFIVRYEVKLRNVFPLYFSFINSMHLNIILQIIILTIIRYICWYHNRIKNRFCSQYILYIYFFLCINNLLYYSKEERVSIVIIIRLYLQQFIMQILIILNRKVNKYDFICISFILKCNNYVR